MYEYKKIKNDNRCYIYDVHSAKIFEVSNLVYELFEELLKDDPKDLLVFNEEKMVAEQQELLDFYNRFKEQKKNMLTVESELNKELIYQNTMAVIDRCYDERKLEKLTFSMTGDCNLACKYCFYSDRYGYSRKRSKSKNSLKDMLNAVDWFAENSNKEKRGVTFYGGEPLLEFKAIKKIVEYCKEKNYNYLYGITTNGTLLKRDIADFLISNNFQIAVSLDVNKDIHDFNRIFPNGDGSYDAIDKNLSYIKNRYPEEYKKIQFLATIDSDNTDNYKAALKIAEKNPKIMINSINESNAEIIEKSNSLNELDQDLYLLAKEKSAKFIEKAGQYFDDSYSLNSIDYFDSLYLDEMKSVCRRNTDKDIMSLSGSCIPIGLKGLMISEIGEIYPCEKIDYCFSLGNIKELNKDFKIANSKKLLERFLSFKIENCLNCWAKNLCNMCFAYCVEDGDFKLPKGKCFYEKQKALAKLERYICLCEKYGEKRIVDFLKDYN